MTGVAMTYKFGSFLNENNGEAEHKYKNTFSHETYPEWSRVVIAPEKNQISLMLDISKQWEGPLGILYVLEISRLGYTPGRYQCPEPCSFESLELFTYTFQKFFEGDGRHHIWFMDCATGAQLVYDHHNLIYSYKNDQDVISFLKQKSFSEGSTMIPSPHHHCYNKNFDNCEDKIMEYFEWKYFPLQQET